MAVVGAPSESGKDVYDFGIDRVTVGGFPSETFLRNQPAIIVSFPNSSRAYAHGMPLAPLSNEARIYSLIVEFPARTRRRKPYKVGREAAGWLRVTTSQFFFFLFFFSSVAPKMDLATHTHLEALRSGLEIVSDDPWGSEWTVLQQRRETTNCWQRLIAINREGQMEESTRRNTFLVQICTNIYTIA